MKLPENVLRVIRNRVLADKKDRIEDRARKVFIFKQRVKKTLNVEFRYVGGKR